MTQLSVTMDHMIFMISHMISCKHSCICVYIYIYIANSKFLWLLIVIGTHLVTLLPLIVWKGVALVTKCIIKVYQKGKGDVVLTIHFIREGIPWLMVEYLS